MATKLTPWEREKVVSERLKTTYNRARSKRAKDIAYKALMEHEKVMLELQRNMIGRKTSR